jgi:hypothetical protein
MDINNLLKLNGCDTGGLINSPLVISNIEPNRIIAESALEYSALNAWNINFGNGNVNNNNKYNSNRVRAVVALDEEIKTGWVIAKNDCLRNKYSSLECEKWRVDYERNLWELVYEIYYGEYVPSTSTCFIVKFPSYREIFAAAFRDRLVQHWICLRLNPLFEGRFRRQMNVSFNCRKGFGTFAAQQALRKDMIWCCKKRQHKNWVGKYDLKGFFMSIDKNILWSLLEKFIKEEYVGDDIDILLNLTKITIYHVPSDNCIKKFSASDRAKLPAHKSMLNNPRHLGLAIGNITSQLCANFYMSFFDAIMLKFCIRYNCLYKRFVDDFTIVGDKNDIMRIRKIAERWLKIYLHVTLHPDKVYLQPIRHGCRFVGGVIKPNRTYLVNRTLGGLHDALFRLNKLCATISQNGPTLQLLKELSRTASSVNSYIGFVVHHKSASMAEKLYAPYVKNIKRCCLIKNTGAVKIQKRYDYKLFMRRKEFEENNAYVW